jgi:hypothetical protein
MSAAPLKNKITMRRIFIFSIFFLAIFSFRLNAQSRFHAGLSAGAIISDVQGTDIRDGDVDFKKLGFMVGGIVHTELNEGNSFQFEINYITKGSMQPPDSLNNGYYKLVLNYLEVPFVFRHKFRFNIAKKPVSHFEMEFGASVGRLVHFDEIVDNYSQTFGPENFNKTDVSLLLGLNYSLSPHIYFGFRYSNSLIPALKKNSIPSYFYRFTFNNGNNMVMQLGLHFIFGKTASPPPPEAPPAN